MLFLLCHTSIVTAAKVAVTDLTYSERVQGYIHVVDYHNKSQLSASDHSSFAASGHGASASSGGSLNASSKTDYFEYEHSYSYIEVGELRKFTGDIKGEMLKSQHFQLVQAKPVTTKMGESTYDIIARIKKGYYPGADYVLFGTVSDMNFSDDVYHAQNSSTDTLTFNLTLVAEFSLVNTRTYEVIAGFSATGEGSDTKILSPGTRATPNRALVVSDVSKSLGKDVIRQLDEQIFGKLSGDSVSEKSSIQNEDGNKSIENGSVMVFH